MQLGYLVSQLASAGVIAGSSVVKLPQATRIARARSVLGLSELTLTAEWIGYSAGNYYNFARRHPFSAWGEAAPITVQSTVILLMYWRFKRGLDIRPRLLFLLAWLAASVWLFTAEVPPAVVTAIGLLPTVALLVARVPQILLNSKQGHTGQLATATIFLQFAGNAARIGTTLCFLGYDPVVLAGHIAGASSNAIILLQIARYKPVTRSVTAYCCEGDSAKHRSHV